MNPVTHVASTPWQAQYGELPDCLPPLEHYVCIHDCRSCPIPPMACDGRQFERMNPETPWDDHALPTPSFEGCRNDGFLCHVCVNRPSAGGSCPATW